MMVKRVYAAIVVLTWTLAVARPALAQSDERSVSLVVQSGRSFRVALNSRLTVKRVGQAITGTLIEPLYAYDRVVVSAGTTVRGQVERLDAAPRMARVRAMFGGDFSPMRRVTFAWDAFVLADGREVPIHSVVTGATERPTRRMAATSQTTDKSGLRATATEQIARAKEEIRQRASDTLSSVKRPGKAERLRDAVVRRLPYHPQFLPKGTVLSAEFTAPVGFGTAIPIERAPAGVLPTPESVLTVRLVTTLDSNKTPRGTPIEAVVTEPVLSEDHQLILPEGTTLRGEVTFAKGAARFHRNGQLRFLFERVQVRDEEAATLLASLHAVETADDDGLVVDEEGGARVTNSKTRFLAPALALAALHGSIGHHPHGVGQDPDGSVGVSAVRSSSVGARGLGGFFGFGLIGASLSQLSRPAGIAFGVVGASRTVYVTVFGKGQDVVFPAGTPLQLQLAPGPTAEQ